MVQGHKRLTIDRLGVRFLLQEMKYFLFRFVVDLKRGVEFLHLTRNASSIKRKMENGSVLRGTLPYPAIRGM